MTPFDNLSTTDRNALIAGGLWAEEYYSQCAAQCEVESFLRSLTAEQLAMQPSSNLNAL